MVDRGSKTVLWISRRRHPLLVIENLRGPISIRAIADGLNEAACKNGISSVESWTPDMPRQTSIAITVGLNNLGEANLFLRALWAEFRAKFGSLAWQYSPVRRRGSQKIALGYAQLGQRGTFGIESCSKLLKPSRGNRFRSIAGFKVQRRSRKDTEAMASSAEDTPPQCLGRSPQSRA
jgi:hypothetical protein